MTGYTFKGHCELCDTPQLIRFEVTRFALRDGYYFETGARCVDRAACRARVEGAGNQWLVIDPEDRYAARALSGAGLEPTAREGLT